ncbi:polyribonucleotide nucleotidyltransferase [Patescibacteria group bacterium]|nr:polyribonucleotide nucleotidyltransferase [Patescibacteria group bacterium]
MQKDSFQIKLGEKEIKIEVGGLAAQASGCCLMKSGETSVLCTAQIGEEKTELGFFPLTCDYEERYYAAGKIGGSRFIRREGRPSAEAVLISRMIDRAVRPLFPENLKNEVQLIATCLSWDEKNDPATLGLVGSSLALSLSEIPWPGPVGVVRIGKIGENFILNPDYEERENGELDLIFAGIEKEDEILINMIEGDGKEISEKVIARAYNFVLPYIKNLIDFQKEIARKMAKEKILIPTPEVDPAFQAETKKFLAKKLEKALYQKEKQKRNSDLESLEEELREKIEKELGEEPSTRAKLGAGLVPHRNEVSGAGKIEQALDIFEKEKERILKENILKKGKRPDGRKLDEIREIEIKAGILPRTHGSGFFSRGLTKILSILTLGAPGDQQLLEGMEISGKKRFIHHYNFPPYSAGEVRPLRGPGRREIGHGMLVEKALRNLVPSFDDFPYTIRVVSEVLSSNGSTSMASVSSVSLALMDAGVPIQRPAAGIAVGMIKKSDSEWKILTDIQGPEDSSGDMDFKVAGSQKGITALQMDVKTNGITLEILNEALGRAKRARLEILEKMKEVLARPRPKLSPFAPRVYVLQIDPGKIGLVIGPGGKVINEIIENCGVSIDIEESGKVYVTAEKETAAKKAVDWIRNITKEIKVGEVFQGKVKRILDFGAMVEIFPGQEGLVHISEFISQRINKVRDVVREGDIIPVKVINIDELGRINLSAKQAGFRPKNYYGRKRK